MKRRDFIKFGIAGSALLSISPWVLSSNEDPTAWRGFRLRYHVELPGLPGKARLWLPLPATEETDYQKSSINIWSGNADKAGFYTVPGNPATAFFAEWNRPGPRHVMVSSVFKITNRALDLSRFTQASETALPAGATRFLKPTQHMPLDGIVRKTALAVTRGATTPLQKAHAIYHWVVDNTFLDPKVRGSGRGDIKTMLETGRLGGKCADINSLFVGLARAAGIPARVVYGIRVAESEAFLSLGEYGDVSEAQHCRAEFYLAGAGWVPVDPADVRKAVLEENLPLQDGRVAALREKLFGSWETNWAAFNHARDFSLVPENASGRLPFFMYPHAEIAGKPLDSHNPRKFAYKIEAHELVGTGVKFDL